MCGVVGLFDLNGQTHFDESVVQAMNESQFHRGPDAGGVHLEQGVAFGHRRLAIIDLSGGAQPLFNEDHSVVVTYNGEIYNFEALSQELKDKNQPYEKWFICNKTASHELKLVNFKYIF